MGDDYYNKLRRKQKRGDNMVAVFTWIVVLAVVVLASMRGGVRVPRRGTEGRRDAGVHRGPRRGARLVHGRVSELRNERCRPVHHLGRQPAGCPGEALRLLGMAVQGRHRSGCRGMIIAPHPKHAAVAAALAGAAVLLGYVGAWPIACILCVEVGIQWVKAWGWQAPDDHQPEEPA